MKTAFAVMSALALSGCCGDIGDHNVIYQGVWVEQDNSYLLHGGIPGKADRTVVVTGDILEVRTSSGTARYATTGIQTIKDSPVSQPIRCGRRPGGVGYRSVELVSADRDTLRARVVAKNGARFTRLEPAPFNAQARVDAYLAYDGSVIDVIVSDMKFYSGWFADIAFEIELPAGERVLENRRFNASRSCTNCPAEPGKQKYDYEFDGRCF